MFCRLSQISAREENVILNPKVIQTTGPKIGFKASGHVEAKTHTNLRKMRQDGASRLNDGGQHRSTATMVHHT